MIFERFLKQTQQPIQNESYEPLYALVRKFEGLYLKSYFCPAGVLTIGYGSTGADIKLGMTVTKEWAESRLKSDLAKFIQGSKLLCPNANHNQLCAIASFAYNVGLGALKTSTFRKKFNAGDISEAKKQMLRWNKAGGKVLKGLTKRREIEASML